MVGVVGSLRNELFDSDLDAGTLLLEGLQARRLKKKHPVEASVPRNYVWGAVVFDFPVPCSRANSMLPRCIQTQLLKPVCPKY